MSDREFPPTQYLGEDIVMRKMSPFWPILRDTIMTLAPGLQCTASSEKYTV